MNTTGLLPARLAGIEGSDFNMRGAENIMTLIDFKELLCQRHPNTYTESDLPFLSASYKSADGSHKRLPAHFDGRSLLQFCETEGVSTVNPLVIAVVNVNHRIRPRDVDGEAPEPRRVRPRTDDKGPHDTKSALNRRTVNVHTDDVHECAESNSSTPTTAAAAAGSAEAGVDRRGKGRATDQSDGASAGDNILLGHFIPLEHRRSEGLDALPVSLRLFSEGFRNDPTCKLLVCRIYKMLVYDNPLYWPLRGVLVRNDLAQTPINNILYGRTQQGKTQAIATLAFIAAIGLGVLSIVTVRSTGGQMTYARLKEDIEAIAEHARRRLKEDISAESGNLSHDLQRTITTFFDPQIAWAIDLKRAEPVVLGDRSRPIVIIARNSKPIIDCLFQSRSMGWNVATEIAKVPRTQSEPIPYAIFSDEDDNSVSSSDRNHTQIEVALHQQPVASFMQTQQFVRGDIPSVQSPSLSDTPRPQSEENWDVLRDDSELSPPPSCSDEELNDDEDDEPADIRTVRNSSQLHVCISATWFATATLESESHTEERLRIIELPMTSAYKRINMALSPPTRLQAGSDEEEGGVDGVADVDMDASAVPLLHNTPFVRIIEMDNIPASLKGEDKKVFVNHPGWSPFTSTLTASYDTAKENWVAVRPRDNPYPDCREQPEVAKRTPPRHVSALISTGATRNTKFQSDQAAMLHTDPHLRGSMMTTFAFNMQATASFFFSRRLTDLIPQFEVLVRAVLHDTFFDNTDRAEAMMASIINRAFDPASVANTSRPNCTVEFSRDYVRVSVEKIEKSKRLLEKYYDIIYAVYMYARIPPFVVCVAGICANRQATFKDSRHRFVLTDMFVDLPRCSHIELAIQMTGRICSTDAYDLIPRRLFLDTAGVTLLRDGLAMYDEFISLCKAHNQPVTFANLIRAVGPEHRCIAAVFRSDAKVTKARTHKYAKELTSYMLRADQTQFEAIAEWWGNSALASHALKADDIHREMQAMGLVRMYDTPETRASCFNEAATTRRPLLIMARLDDQRVERSATSSIHGALHAGKHAGRVEGNGQNGWRLVSQPPPVVC